MPALKLSQITAASGAPAGTDTVIGVQGGTTDLQYTINQLRTAIAAAAASTTLTAGAGLTGGGDLTANRTFDVGGSTSIIVGVDDVQRAALTGDVTAAQNVNATVIANKAVTYAKIQDVAATARILGRKTAAAGTAEECTLSDVLDFIGSAAQGDILYRGASTWARLGAGTSGRFLQTLGSGQNPAWASILMGGRVVTAASDTMLDSDNFDVVQYNRSTAIAVTLPQAGASGQFVAGWNVTLRNLGVGQVTITPTTSTINEGAQICTLDQNEWAQLYSDGTNYTINKSMPIDNMTTTWTNSIVQYSAIKISVTDNASAASSRLILGQVGGNPKFSVDKTGALNLIGPITLGASGDVSLVRNAAAVILLGDGGANSNGWLQSAGAQRLASDQVFTSNVTLASIFTFNVLAGRTYAFDFVFLMTTGASAGGIKIGIGGSCTITNLIADGMCIDGTTVIACTRRSAFGAGNEVVNALNAGTTPVAHIFGTITVNAAGTLLFRFAQNTSSATSSTVKQGSWAVLNDVL